MRLHGFVATVVVIAVLVMTALVAVRGWASGASDPPMAHAVVRVTNASRQPLTPDELARFGGEWPKVLEACAPITKYHLYNGEKRLRLRCSHLAGSGDSWVDVDPGYGHVLQVVAVKP